MLNTCMGTSIHELDDIGTTELFEDYMIVGVDDYFYLKIHWKLQTSKLESIAQIMSPNYCIYFHYLQFPLKMTF